MRHPDPLGPARVAPVTNRVAEVGLESDGRIVVCDCAIQIALLCACVASVVEGDGVAGLESDGFIEVRECTVQVAFVVARETSVEKSFGKVGLEADGLAIEADFLIVVGCVNPTLEPLLCGQLVVANGASLRSRTRLLGCDVA